MKLLDHFEKIIELIKENGLNETFLEKAKDHLDMTSSLLQINHVQAALFAMFLDRFEKNSISTESIADAVKCSNIQLLRYMDDFEILKQKKLIRTVKRGRFSSNGSNFGGYSVPLDVIKAIRSNTEYKHTAYDNLSPEEFFDCVRRLLDDLSEENIDFETWQIEIDYIFSLNKDLPFVRKQKEYDLGEGSIPIMLIFCCELYKNDKEIMGEDELRSELIDIFGHRNANEAMNRLESGEHKLIDKGLIEFCCQNGMADTERYCLTQKAKDEFLSDLNLKVNTKKQKNKSVIRVENIPVKKLFFNEKIRSRISELTDLLQEKNFSDVQKRLAESGMRTGFACLFSGSPGTGKTETAYQIARETGREIMLVDIADTKSMWFGESEKKIKAVFNRYRGIVRSGGIVPILFFNEADAILGKRRELSKSKSGPDQTENAIQNIILQEMETLNGILIATTNMTVNLDKAFERRFLYKIEFDKPDNDSKKQIWQNMIPAISDIEAVRLAREFDFSGGQIENIARKSTVSYILKGAVPDLSVLEKFCREELLEKTVPRIGFCTEHILA